MKNAINTNSSAFHSLCLPTQKYEEPNELTMLLKVNLSLLFALNFKQTVFIFIFNLGRLKAYSSVEISTDMKKYICLCFQIFD